MNVDQFLTTLIDKVGATATSSHDKGEFLNDLGKFWMKAMLQTKNCEAGKTLETRMLMLSVSSLFLCIGTPDPDDDYLGTDNTRDLLLWLADNIQSFRYLSLWTINHFEKPLSELMDAADLAVAQVEKDRECEVVH